MTTTIVIQTGATAPCTMGPRPFYPPGVCLPSGLRPGVSASVWLCAAGELSAQLQQCERQQQRQRNINNNNNNYFNRFDENQNLRGGSAQSPLASTRHAGAGSRAEDWKGQSSYAGARDTATGARANQEAGARQAAAERAGTGDKPAGGATRTRPESPAGAGAQARDLKADRSSREDRGHGDAARTENRGAAESRTRPEGRDPGTVSRPTQTTAGARSHDNAFAGAHDDEGGSFDRAASARGHASKDGGGARQQHASRGERR